MKKKFKTINFIVGLSNWGKSTCLQKIVGKKRIVGKYYDKFRIFKIGGKECLILQFSNCDLGINEFLKELKKLLQQMQDEDIGYAYVALCSNLIFNMKKVLGIIPDNYRINLIFLEYHWDKVAKLNIDFIIKQLKDFKISYKILENSNDCKEIDNVE